MKTIDVTPTVMERIVRFEKRRMTLWITRFFLIVAILGIGALLFAWASIQEIAQQKTGELLELFVEDREIIAEYWHDVVLTVWEELPQPMIFIAVLFVGAVMVVLWATRHQRTVIRKKFGQLRTYKIFKKRKEGYES